MFLIDLNSRGAGSISILVGATLGVPLFALSPKEGDWRPLGVAPFMALNSRRGPASATAVRLVSGRLDHADIELSGRTVFPIRQAKQFEGGQFQKLPPPVSSSRGA